VGLPFVANLSLADPTVWHFAHPRRGRRTARVQARITVDATTAVHAAVLASARTHRSGASSPAT